MVLYYRHVLGLELHHIAGYESGADFYHLRTGTTRPLAVCASGKPAASPFYRSEVPAHIGVMISPVKCLHARGVRFRALRQSAGITEGLQQSGVHGAWCDMSYRGCLARRCSGTVGAGTTGESAGFPAAAPRCYRETEWPGRLTITISAGHRDLSDVVAVFDQPEGGVGKLITTILRPVTKNLSGALKVFGPVK